MHSIVVQRFGLGQDDVQDKVVSFPVTTITLSHDIQDPYGTRLKMFHCYSCTTPLGQYKGFVYSIMPGQPVQGSLPWIQMCKVCKLKYCIQGIV